ncbi:MAG: GTP pyrophosphokinase [Methanobacterium sp.]
MELKEYVNEYELILYPKYKNFTVKLETLLKDFLDQEKINFFIESRTKTVESFKEKINRPYKNYKSPLNEITDLTGIKIIVSSLDDVEKVKKLIEKEFNIDEERSINKFESLKTDQFGYLSQHFIIKINESRQNLPEWFSMKDLWAEIQVRTVLQHAWANVSHFLEYKNEIDVPQKFKRKLYMLSAVFELADENLNGLINDISALSEEYKEKIDSKELKIEINVNSLKTYLKSSENVSYWMHAVKGEGFNPKPVDNPSVLIKFMKKANINSIEELDNLLEKAKKDYNDLLDTQFNVKGNGIPISGGILVYDDEVISLIIKYYYPEITSSIFEPS